MKKEIRLVQIQDNSDGSRRVGFVHGNLLYLLNDFFTAYDLVFHAINSGVSLGNLIERKISTETLGYNEIHAGISEWNLLPSFDHPADPNRCMLSGTGLSHKASAENRQKMHVSDEKHSPTDSMKMYLWGMEGGKPEEGKIGVQPEWFYKGNGALLKGHRDVLYTPSYADDGGEEPEIAGVYLIDSAAVPWRIGFTTANEFSDHVMERKNYLYLAPSKIRNCSIGPELVINPDLKSISGTVSLYRDNRLLWKRDIKTGENNMSHSIDNLEYHHFKYDNHRLPGQVHIHFLGADAFSFGEGYKLEDGDRIEIHWEKMGRPLVNTVLRDKGHDQALKIKRIS